MRLGLGLGFSKLKALLDLIISPFTWNSIDDTWDELDMITWDELEP